VPLNSTRPSKCDAPRRGWSSSREPTPTQNPMVTERTSGIGSVTSVSPLPSTSVRMAKPLPPPTPARAPSGASAATTLPPPAATGGLRGPEVAELLLELALERVLEGHHLRGP